MKVLVYGAGVIGCYLTHVLCAAGNDVTLLARGKWKDTLETRGLEIRHHLQRRTTLDRPRIIGAIPDERFDAAFAVLPYHQMPDILGDLAAVDSPLVVPVGNNFSPAEMERAIKARSKAPKTVLFGFQATAGEHQAERIVCERLGAGTMDIGALHALPSRDLRLSLEAAFRGTGYRLHWQSDMEAYLICHAAAILPIGYAVYADGGDLRASTPAQRKAMMAASREAYDMLAAQGLPIRPVGDDGFYRGGAKYAAMKLLYFLMGKTEMGDLIACAHCRRASREMELIDEGFAEVRAKTPDFPMPAWDALRASMPPWEEIHRTYGGARPGA